MFIDVICGIVSDVRPSAYSNDGNSNFHTIVFKIQETTIRLLTTAPAFISNGEEVVVVGRFEDGIFEARAYKNKSLGLVGYSNYKNAYFASAVAIGIGSFALYMESVSRFPSVASFPVLMAGICFLSAFFIFRSGEKISIMLRELDKY